METEKRLNPEKDLVVELNNDLECFNKNRMRKLESLVVGLQEKLKSTEVADYENKKLRGIVKELLKLISNPVQIEGGALEHMAVIENRISWYRKCNVVRERIIKDFNFDV